MLGISPPLGRPTHARQARNAAFGISADESTIAGHCALCRWACVRQMTAELGKRDGLVTGTERLGRSRRPGGVLRSAVIWAAMAG